ncbi:stage V sporulation protein D [Paenibacillus darwinianus]|uniref:Stage V sporulation protein D n=1 Tax=Paenibacillus darwinianus TaxID=1380763 RepID=A0A9W5S3S5_9BACL|nr:penicillin-binding transpeptidase domain-containing protein [Paenibacillus darwinianus]EXX91686.1 stage V sporulation protein D [Paenibacillus darwinianus]EXX92543.1 stage V sporulation protein D [Paenibacillus darwinianus]EXX92678.1 stage V sporulation protein D [Paenibacillus darwinianus]
MNKRIKLRTLLIGGLITLLFLVLVGRVYFVQVVRADFWYEKAKEAWTTSENIPAARGTITDREGNVLAMDVAGFTVAVNPKVVNELGLADQIASKFNLLLGKPESELRDILTKKNKKGEFYLQREVRSEGWKIDKELADRVEAFKQQLRQQTGEKDVGIYLIEDQKRFYPKNTMASHVLGYLNKAGDAVNGLELSLDRYLRGTDGKIKYERDGNRVKLADGDVEYVPAKDGSNVALTIDTEIQYYIEKAIKDTYDKSQPRSITAIAADPNTMEILGMATLPNFNPNVYWETPEGADFNYAIKGLIEPGSTFKIATLAAAVEEGIFNPDETYKSGSITIAGSPLRDYNRVGWGEISYLEGLKRSSNVAFIKLGYEKMKNETFMNYIRNFGFGQKTGIELNGEVSGSVAATYATEKATLTFGQGRVQVTPIQQVAAVAAVANGGKLMQPHLVKEITDPATKKVVKVEPKVVRQVISSESARKVGEYLETVVSDQEIGTGKNAYIEGYRVAGKTGTAQKVIDGKYDDEKYVVSFIGYAPVEDPKIVVYVVVDEPIDRFAGGGSVAAPVFKEIVLQSLRHMGVAPNNAVKPAEGNKELSVTAPDMTELKVAQAAEELRSRVLGYEVVGKGDTVLQQIPKAGTNIAPSQRIYLVTEQRDKLEVPNVRGLSLRDAVEVCSLLGMRCVTEGQGFVKQQILATAKGERFLKLVLEPPGEPAPPAAPADGAAADEAAAQPGPAETDG